MGTYHGPKVRLTRRVGSPIAETPKHTNVRRPTRPGVHGRRRPRQSLYGAQLAEKQKTVKPGSEVFVHAAMESAGESEIQVPGWLSADNEALRAKVLRLPAPEEIRLPFEIDVAKIIEMYTR